MKAEWIHLRKDLEIKVWVSDKKRMVPRVNAPNMGVARGFFYVWVKTMMEEICQRLKNN